MRLITIYRKLVLSLLGLLAVPIFLIHGQPYDDHELRSLLIPSGCPLPCFMDIRPGVTTVDEAADLLRRNPWVDASSVNVFERFNVVRLEWRWSGLQPSFFSDDSRGMGVATVLPGFNGGAHLTDSERVVTGIVVFTTLPYGEARLLLGRGSNRAHYRLASQFINPRISAVYPEDGVAVLSQLMRCPVHIGEFWNEPVTLEIGYTFVDDKMHVCRGLR